MHGLVGEFIRIVGPHTEADRAALLFSYLAAFGSVIGRGPHFVAEADRHYTNIFVVQVGITSKGRKGSSLGQVRRVFRAVDERWSSERVQSGLSSGEGLIWAVRDAVEKEEPLKDNKRVVDQQPVVIDPGVADKRLLVVEGEFASTLRVMAREGNTLSAVIRNAWDSGDMRILAKNCPARSTGAHISIIAHITKEELLRRLDGMEAANGFGNRFLWVCVKRSKVLPEGSKLSDGDLAEHIKKLQAAVEFARRVDRMERDDEARVLWHEVYPDLSEGRPGMLGAITARAEAQVMRLACISALLDSSAVVKRTHLEAALEMWRYARDSARFIFGESLGDPLADELLGRLREEPHGMTRTEIYDLFSRNKTSREIRSALNLLLEYGLVCRELAETREGRPAERWYAIWPEQASESPRPDHHPLDRDRAASGPLRARQDQYERNETSAHEGVSSFVSYRGSHMPSRPVRSPQQGYERNETSAHEGVSSFNSYRRDRAASGRVRSGEQGYERNEISAHEGVSSFNSYRRDRAVSGPVRDEETDERNEITTRESSEAAHGPGYLGPPPWDCPACRRSVLLRLNDAGDTWYYKCRCGHKGSVPVDKYRELRDRDLGWV